MAVPPRADHQQGPGAARAAGKLRGSCSQSIRCSTRREQPPLRHRRGAASSRPMLSGNSQPALLGKSQTNWEWNPIIICLSCYWPLNIPHRAVCPDKANLVYNSLATEHYASHICLAHVLHSRFQAESSLFWRKTTKCARPCRYGLRNPSCSDPQRVPGSDALSRVRGRTELRGKGEGQRYAGGPPFGNAILSGRPPAHLPQAGG